MVYSWPQKTCVAGGSEPSLATPSSICSGPPSKNRPQPPTNSASPVKIAAGAPTLVGSVIMYDM